MLKQVFFGENWIITPEKFDPNTNKKPDLLVEKVVTLESNKKIPTLYLIMELKSSEGNRFEEAVAQSVENIFETIDETGNAVRDAKGMATEDASFDVYVVAQRGTKIGFFEYHNHDMEELNIPHFRGCTSLTQDCVNGYEDEIVLHRKPNDLDILFHNSDNLRTEKLKGKDAEKIQAIRAEAEKYTTPCVFDLEKHEEEINLLFNHILLHKPRTSVDLR